MDMNLAVAPRPAVRTRVVLWLLSGVVLTGLSILFVDQPVSTWSHDMLHRPLWSVEAQKIAGVVYLGGAALAVLVAAVIVRLTGRRMGPLWRTAVGAALATLVAALAVTFIKYGFGRLWPETWTHNNPSWINNHAYGFMPFHGGEGYESFPSGHTARITAPFAVLWHRVPRLRVLWALPTLAVAVALIAADFHFVGDCIAGAYLGVASAALVMTFL
jgi:membrane-associated phospholipid phosphatase